MPPINHGSQLVAVLRIGAQIVSAAYVGSQQTYSANMTPVAPTNITLSASSVSESAAIGTVVGLLSANGYPSSAYSKILDASNKFAVVGNELRLAAALDYETATSHSVTVRATNSAGSYDKVFAISVTNATELPINTVAPSISGAPTQGGTLTGADGTWTSAAGAISYARAWLRDGLAISGATGNTYVLDAADVGAMIGYRVTATNSDGSTQTTSSAVGPIAAAAGLLDAVGGVAPAVAASTKKLFSSYSGPCLRVIRPSDSAELDIGFFGDVLDAASLSAFLGSEVGKVNVFYDQSGAGNHLTQTVDSVRPKIETITIGGVPALILNSGQLDIPASVSVQRNTFKAFIVAEPFGAGAGLSSLLQLGSGSNQVTVYQQTSRLNGNPGIAATTYRIQTRASLYALELTATRAALDQNSESMAGSSPADLTMTGGYLGKTTLGAYPGQQYLSAAIIYARAVTASETAAISSALNTGFGIDPAPDPAVIFCGDSITIASAAHSPNYYGYAKMAQRGLPSAKVFNFAGGGTQIQNDLATYSTTIGPVISMYSGKRIVFLFKGTNDLTLGARTAAQIYSDLQTYAGYIRASGGLVVIATLLPNSAWNTTQQTTRNDLNTLIRTNWASFADALSDFASNVTMGPQAAASNTSLYGDGLHPTRLGHSYLAPDAIAAISSLF